MIVDGVGLTGTDDMEYERIDVEISNHRIFRILGLN
jgi:hypothetical protein